MRFLDGPMRSWNLVETNRLISGKSARIFWEIDRSCRGFCCNLEKILVVVECHWLRKSVLADVIAKFHGRIGSPKDAVGRTNGKINRCWFGKKKMGHWRRKSGKKRNLFRFFLENQEILEVKFYHLCSVKNLWSDVTSFVHFIVSSMLESLCSDILSLTIFSLSCVLLNPTEELVLIFPRKSKKFKWCFISCSISFLFCWEYLKWYYIICTLHCFQCVWKVFVVTSYPWQYFFFILCSLKTDQRICILLFLKRYENPWNDILSLTLSFFPFLFRV